MANMRDKVERSPAIIANQLARRIFDIRSARSGFLADANAAIRQALSESRPFLVTRMGSVETAIVRRADLNSRINMPIGPILLRQMELNAGVYPRSAQSALSMAQRYRSALSTVDLLAMWGNYGERSIRRRYAPASVRTALSDLGPFSNPDPWTDYLEGKRVLVVHPFAKTIGAQYARRTEVYKGRFKLPEFDLRALQAVQSGGGQIPPHDSWEESLDVQCREISDIAFDVAIIGAGAYGLPIGQHVRAMGRVAIHLGAMTQLLFGVMGKRWEQRSDTYSDLAIDWVRPSTDERPPLASSVEGGCYW